MTTRNSNTRFDSAPQVSVERSSFDMSFDVKTSFDVGRLIPFALLEVLPGDTFQIATSKVMRLQTLITPVMDNLYLDTYYFFVPNRLVWEHWEQFIGGNFENSSWVGPVDYKIPEVYPPYAEDNLGWKTGTIADYMGVPVGVYNQSETEGGINALPFRCYAKIVEDWFRDENLQDPIYIPTGDSYIVGDNLNDNSPSQYVKGGYPFIAAKYHDYFTSCLPKPQKGPDVSFLAGYAPVMPMRTGSGYMTENNPLAQIVPNMIVRNTSVSAQDPRPHPLITSKNIGANASGNAYTTDTQNTFGSGVYFSNLFADLANTVLPGGYSTTSINTLRMAFQIQRLLERDARGGTRYIELIKSHFGVTSPDYRLQRAEYLGGNRVPFNIEQVLQTSSTDNTSPQGNVTGWSQTNDMHFDVERNSITA